MARSIHPAALPNDLPAEALHLRPDASGGVRVDPGVAAWRYLTFQTVVADGDGVVIPSAGDSETCVVVIGGRDLVIEGGGERWQLEGRDDPVRRTAVRALAARRPRDATQRGNGRGNGRDRASPAVGE